MVGMKQKFDVCEVEMWQLQQLSNYFFSAQIIIRNGMTVIESVVTNIHILKSSGKVTYLPVVGALNLRG